MTTKSSGVIAPTESQGPSTGVAAVTAGSTSLAEALPKQIERCQEILVQYAAIGPAGQFGAMMIRQDIAAAHRAMMEGDVVGMLRGYEALKDCQ